MVTIRIEALTDDKNLAKVAKVVAEALMASGRSVALYGVGVPPIPPEEEHTRPLPDVKITQSWEYPR